jgi:hypothetical protein
MTCTEFFGLHSHLSFPASFASSDAKRGKGIQLSRNRLIVTELDSRFRGNDKGAVRGDDKRAAPPANDGCAP